MSIKDKDVFAFIAEQDQWVQRNQSNWRAIRSAYADEFWAGAFAGGTSDGTARNPNASFMVDYPILVQVNYLRSWVFSYVDAIFHQGLRAIVNPPTIPRGDATVVLGTPERNLADPGNPRPAERMTELSNAWFSLLDIENDTERAFIIGMVYPEWALKIGAYGDDRNNPVEDIWMDVLPPWECFWDRKARNEKSLRWIGHLYYMPIEEAMAKWDIPASDLEGVSAPDVLEEGQLSQDSSRDFAWTGDNNVIDRNYVRVCEFYDYTSNWEVDKKTKLDGEYRVYIVEGYKDKTMREQAVYRGPFPYDRPNGKPMCPIQPMAFISLPEYPLDGVSPAQGQYDLGAELNYVHTFMVNAARRDAARVLMVLKEKFNEEELTKLTSGTDMQVVEIEDENAMIGNIAKWLEQQPVSTSVMQVYQMLEAAKDKTAMTTPLSRGESVKYATAAEINSLNAFTETTLGRIARKMNVALVRMQEMFYRVLAARMKDEDRASIQLIVDNEVWSVDRPMLDEDWQITVVDTANTPLGEAEKRRDFQLIYPVLMELWEAAHGGNVMAKELLDYVVDIYNLPSNLSFQTLSAQAPAPETAPAPAVPPGPGGAPGGAPPGMPPMGGQPTGPEGSPVGMPLPQPPSGGMQ